MAKKNEILEEQRKAREQFLELKRMQQSGVDSSEKTDQKVSNLSTIEKVKNFFYYNKWYIVIVLLIVAVTVYSITSSLSRVKPDMKVVLFLYEPVAESQLDGMKNYMEDICEDINGDGEVNISIINCSFDASANDGQYQTVIFNKMQAILSADYDSLLFITNDESYKYFSENEISEGLFTEEPCKFSEGVYEKISSGDIPFMKEGLQISLRTYYDTVLEGDKKTKAVYDESLKILKEIKKESDAK